MQHMLCASAKGQLLPLSESWSRFFSPVLFRSSWDISDELVTSRWTVSLVGMLHCSITLRTNCFTICTQDLLLLCRLTHPPGFCQNMSWGYSYCISASGICTLRSTVKNSGHAGKTSHWRSGCVSAGWKRIKLFFLMCLSCFSLVCRMYSSNPI